MRKSDETDETLMSRLSEGDLDAATPLFRRHRTALFNFFLRLGFAPDESEDMLQTVFERLIRYRQSYRAGQAFRTWLYQIARNVRADFYQKRPRFSPPDEMALRQAQVPAEDSLEREETLAQLDKALQSLPADQLEILLLTRFQGLRYAQVGELLGCSEGAVKAKVFRAMQQLRSLFLTLH